MRFGIHDLLWLTLLVAIYCVVFTLAPVRTTSWLALAASSVSMVIVPIMAAWWWRTSSRIGVVLSSFRAPGFWRVHFLFAGLALAFAVVLKIRGSGFSMPVLGQLVAMHGMFLFFMSGVRLGERGVAFGPTFMAWEGYQFELRGDQLLWRRRAASSVFAYPSEGKIKVPEAEVDAVRSVVEERSLID